jgi:hypothetical protein
MVASRMESIAVVLVRTIFGHRLIAPLVLVKRKLWRCGLGDCLNPKEMYSGVDESAMH